MPRLRLNAQHWKQFSNGISESRSDWIKEISNTIVTIMERQRVLMGLSTKDYYTEFLGCKMSYKTLTNILEKESLISSELLLSFCFTYGYDIKKFLEVFKLIHTNDSFDEYQQIGAAIEALGKRGIYETSINMTQACPSAGLQQRKRLSKILYEFGQSLPDEDNEYDYLAENKAIEEINHSVRQQIEELKRQQEKEAHTTEIKIKETL